MLNRVTRHKMLMAIATAVVALWYAGVCHPQSAQAQEPARPIGKPIVIKAPLGLPPVPVPADNPPTAETVALGRRLYYDKALSADNTISCASCHGPANGFTDNKAFSSGVGGKLGGRSAPTVINSVYNTLQFWDGRAPSLEEQAKGPIQNPVEMAFTLDGVVKHLQADASYREAFRTAWGTDQITIDMVAKSIASFERTVLSGASPFDRYYYGHDKKALSASAKRGLKVFQDPKKGNCAVCHTIGEKYALFTDNKFHNIGIGADTRGNFTDTGRAAISKNDADTGAFKTPTLRNISQTAPYVHDGSLPTLKDVIDHYIGGGNSNPHLDKEIHVLDFLTGQEREDLLEFLKSLDGKLPPDVGAPPSK
ncbi:MAG: c-type cytochrome [Acidobacteriia bacterium]|nr:c-type cytochrome [Terriglobia bacterium]